MPDIHELKVIGLQTTKKKLMHSMEEMFDNPVGMVKMFDNPV